MESYLFQQKTILVTLVLLIKCIILVKGYFLDDKGYHPDKDDESQQTNRDPITLRGRTINKSWSGYRRRTGNRIRQRFRYPWKPRPRNVPTTKPTATPKVNPDICRNHSKVSRVEDEPGPIVCLRKSTNDLLVQLESVGGLAKRYAAVNVTEACSFEDLTAFPKGQPKAPDGVTKTSEVTKPTVKKNLGGKHQADQEGSDLKLQRLKRSLPTSPGTRIRGCQGRGTIPDDTNLHRLCTECAATTRLSDDQFPNYINEVICRDSDRQCAAKMGLCFQRTIQLSFLRFDGKFELDTELTLLAGKTVYKEVWELYTQGIRSCCECEMYPSIYHAIASRDDGDDGDGDGDDDDDDDDEQGDES